MLTNVPVCARAGRAKLGKGLSKGSDCVCACSGASAEAWRKAGQIHREGQVHRGIVHLAIVGRTGATCQRLARGDTGTHNSDCSGDVMYNREARKAELFRNSKYQKGMSSVKCAHALSQQTNTCRRAYNRRYIRYRCAHTRTNHLITSPLSARQILSIIHRDKGSRQRVVSQRSESSQQTYLTWNSRARQNWTLNCQSAQKTFCLAHTCTLPPSTSALSVC